MTSNGYLNDASDELAQAYAKRREAWEARAGRRARTEAALRTFLEAVGYTGPLTLGPEPIGDWQSRPSPLWPTGQGGGPGPGAPDAARAEGGAGLPPSRGAKISASGSPFSEAAGVLEPWWDALAELDWRLMDLDREGEAEGEGEGDAMADEVFGLAVADLVPGPPSPESLLRKLAYLLRADRVVCVASAGDWMRAMGSEPIGADTLATLEEAGLFLLAQSAQSPDAPEGPSRPRRGPDSPESPRDATPAAEATTGPSGPSEAASLMPNWEEAFGRWGGTGALTVAPGTPPDPDSLAGQLEALGFRGVKITGIRMSQGEAPPAENGGQKNPAESPSSQPHAWMQGDVVEFTAGGGRTVRGVVGGVSGGMVEVEVAVAGEGGVRWCVPGTALRRVPGPAAGPAPCPFAAGDAVEFTGPAGEVVRGVFDGLYHPLGARVLPADGGATWHVAAATLRAADPWPVDVDEATPPEVLVELMTGAGPVRIERDGGAFHAMLFPDQGPPVHASPGPSPAAALRGLWRSLPEGVRARCRGEAAPASPPGTDSGPLGWIVARFGRVEYGEIFGTVAAKAEGSVAVGLGRNPAAATRDLRAKLEGREPMNPGPYS